MYNLNLYIPETFDTRTFLVQDMSEYANPPVNTILEIKAPGSPCFVPIYLAKGWCGKVLNCSLLKICCEDCPARLSDLPDGLYEIKYSIDPNLSMLVEFNHLRTTSLSKQLTGVVCKFFGKKCDYKKSEYHNLLNKLIEIEFTIRAAKGAVEECLDKEEGLALYERAKELLKEFNDGCGCN